MDDDLDAEPVTDRARSGGVVGGFGSDAVIDVVRDDVEAGVEGQGQERGRVGATREGGGDGAWRVREGAAGEEPVELVQSSCSRPRFPPG